MGDDIRQATTEGKLQDFDARVQALKQMGGAKQVQKQHDGGKLTARERLDRLFDEGSFQEVQLFVKDRKSVV